MDQVFVSYDQEDSSFAHQLANDLRRLGIAVWIAPESIRPGEGWVEAINRGLEESTHMVVVLTRAATESKWVQKETDVAIALERQGKMQVIPLDVEPCEIPAIWSSYQMIPFRHDYQTGLNELAALLNLNVEPFESARSSEVPLPSAPAKVDLTQVSERFNRVVAEQLEVTTFRPESNLIYDLGADELDIEEFRLGLEEEFEIEILPQESYDWDTKSLRLQTLADWKAYVSDRLQS